MVSVSISIWKACLLLLSIPRAASRPLQDASVALAPAAAAAAYSLPRLVIYFQTTHDASGNPISMLPLINQKGIALTHLIVCSLHINANGQIHLNDYPPSDPHFATLWNETAVLQKAGVRVMGMVGGAAAGSFASNTLDSTNDTVFANYYAQLHDVITGYGLQGMDLDVEQAMSQAGITRLVNRLHSDFGSSGAFEVTLAPVASALDPGGSGANLSGFDYAQLEAASGSSIAFYNAQFYNGFGTMASPADYEAVVGNGTAGGAGSWPPSKVLMGEITAPSAGSGYVAPDVLNQTVVALRARYGGSQLGGIMGWEYFNSAPGGTAAPWQWAQDMTAILRPGQVPKLTITAADARRLEAAWQQSVRAADSGGETAAIVRPSVDYMAMVNA